MLKDSPCLHLFALLGERRRVPWPQHTHTHTCTHTHVHTHVYMHTQQHKHNIHTHTHTHVSASSSKQQQAAANSSKQQQAAASKQQQFQQQRGGKSWAASPELGVCSPHLERLSPGPVMQELQRPRRLAQRHLAAAGESSVTLLTLSLPLVGVSIGMGRGCQQNDSLADWLSAT